MDGSEVFLKASREAPLPAAAGSFTWTTRNVLSNRVATFCLRMVADADQVVPETSEGNKRRGAAAPAKQPLRE